MKEKNDYLVSHILNPSFVIDDVLRIIKDIPSVDNFHSIKQKWFIGRRFVQEDARWREYGGMDYEIKKKVSMVLVNKVGKEYSLEKINSYVRFYNSHLNLFNKLNDSNSILSWEHYLCSMKIKDISKRSQLEKISYLNNWSVETLQKEILKLK